MPAVGVDFDPLGAARDLTPYDGINRLRTIDFVRALRNATIGHEPGRSVEAASDDRARYRNDVRPGDRRFLDCAAQTDVGFARAFGAEVAHGRKARFKRTLRCGDRARDAQRRVVAQDLVVPRPHVVRNEQQVRVEIDETGQKRRAGEIDDFVCLAASVGTGADDSLSVDADRPTLVAPFAVEYRVRP